MGARLLPANLRRWGHCQTRLPPRQDSRPRRRPAPWHWFRKSFRFVGQSVPVGIDIHFNCFVEAHRPHVPSLSM